MRIQAELCALNHAPVGTVAAILAKAVDLECVPCGLVVVLAADLLLKPIDLRREELDRASAAGTDHVVVAAAIVLMLVARNAVMEGDFTRESTLGQELEGAIYGGKSDARIALTDQLVKLLGGEMLVGLKEREEDGVALLRLLQPDPLQVLMKTVLGFAERLPRNRQLIVNTLLEHRFNRRKASSEDNIREERMNLLIGHPVTYTDLVLC